VSSRIGLGQLLHLEIWAKQAVCSITVNAPGWNAAVRASLVGPAQAVARSQGRLVECCPKRGANFGVGGRQIHVLTNEKEEVERENIWCWQSNKHTPPTAGTGRKESLGAASCPLHGTISSPTDCRHACACRTARETRALNMKPLGVRFGL
jgi:hypothetical protein